MGYVVIDCEKTDAAIEIERELKAIEGTIKCRILL